MHLFLSQLIRFITDKDYSLLGFKRLYKKLDYETYEKLKMILDLSGPSQSLENVKLIINVF